MKSELCVGMDRGTGAVQAESWEIEEQKYTMMKTALAELSGKTV